MRYHKVSELEDQELHYMTLLQLYREIKKI